MDVYKILTLFGFPTLFVGGIGIIHSRMRELRQNQKAQAQAQNEENLALKLGLQALLQDRLLQGYTYYMDRGWIDFTERKVYLNLYNQYHALGENGIMTDYKNKVMALPTSLPKKEMIV